MSGVLFQYCTYRGVDDWLLTLGPCRFFFGGGRRLSYLSEVRAIGFMSFQLFGCFPRHSFIASLVALPFTMSATRDLDNVFVRVCRVSLLELWSLLSRALWFFSWMSSYRKMESFLFTSESVNEGHPDKLCDQISDAILDACLEQDPESKVACETCTKTNMVMVFGEITTKANVDYEKIVRKTCREIGFISDDVGLDADNCKVLVNIEQQSPDIAQGVHGHLTKKPEDIGAGDQGHMFGYATDETPELMPLSHVLATKLGAKLTEVRKNGTCAWLRPDAR
ncbi:hypothetical protein YC2023_038983 [Brassica napus]